MFPSAFWGSDIDTFGRVMQDPARRGEGYLFYCYASTNGSYLETSYSAAEPYCQWASYHYKLAGQRGYDCVLAVAAYAYDVFIGRFDSAGDLANKAMYVSTADDKYG